MSEPTTPIAELMDKDPTKLTDRDLDTIIKELREQRHRFVTAGDRKIGTPASRKSKAQKERESNTALLSKDELSKIIGDL